MNPKKQGILAHFVSIVSFITLLIGFILAVWDQTNPPQSSALTTNQPKSSTTTTKQDGLLLGLGDSLTRGIGDSQGLGYFGRVREALEKENNKITAINLAISGQTSDDLQKQLNQREVQQMIRQARWITMTIGGNDLFRGAGGLEELNIDKAAVSRNTFEKNLNNMFAKIRQLNPNATVYMFALYNPFGDLAEEKTSSQLVREWNQVMEKVAANHSNIVIIPTFDLFQLEPSKYLYSDHFHPNDKGYELMATRLLQVLLDQQTEVK